MDRDLSQGLSSPFLLVPSRLGKNLVLVISGLEDA